MWFDSESDWLIGWLIESHYAPPPSSLSALFFLPPGSFSSPAQIVDTRLSICGLWKWSDWQPTSTHPSILPPLHSSFHIVNWILSINSPRHDGKGHLFLIASSHAGSLRTFFIRLPGRQSETKIVCLCCWSPSGCSHFLILSETSAAEPHKGFLITQSVCKVLQDQYTTLPFWHFIWNLILLRQCCQPDEYYTLSIVAYFYDVRDRSWARFIICKLFQF